MPTQKIRLYHYWRSSSSWRVRWAFAIKGIVYEPVAVDILSGEVDLPEHLKRNPLGYLPVIEFLGDGEIGRYPFLFESMAIIEWAEEEYPAEPLLPGSSRDRAWVRQLAEIINAGTQPLQNVGVMDLHSSDPGQKKAWASHWIRKGLGAYEQILASRPDLRSTRFSCGDKVTLADLYLIPQCYNALRFSIALEEFPKIHQIYLAALQTPGYLASEPERFKTV